MKEIVLGNRVRDRISGYTGIVTARTEFLNQCTRFAVQAEELHAGKPVDAQWFDSVDLIYVDEGILEVAVVPPGGPPARIAEPRGR